MRERDREKGKEGEREIVSKKIEQRETEKEVAKNKEVERKS